MTTPSHGAYRADIDGLRALAVLGVILFHAGNPWAAGGYIGVDVFFVISGYLITGILKRELAAGTFSLARFYERRARRILPALIVVLAATLGAGATLMFADDARVVGRSALAVVLFGANFLFWRGSEPRTDNYFAHQLDEQPLLHTWSLGVEEQYYLLFPVVLLAIARARRQSVGITFITAAVISFALCAWLTTVDVTSAFYLLPTRVWQLLVGALLAWQGATAAPARRDVHELIALAGLALIVLPMAAFSEATPYPGWNAAFPVLGVVLLIRYAPGSTVGRLLAARPVVFVGLISYSAYLWHQPLFAFARYTSLSTDLGAARATLLCLATLLLAAITWRWVETPFRDRRFVSPRSFAAAAVAGLMVVAIPAAVLGFGDRAARRSPVATNVVGQAALSMFTDCNSSKQLTRRLGPGCLLNPSSSATPSFLVLGDSHADALFPAFASASQATGRQGRLFQHMACSPMLEHPDSRVPATPGCRAVMQQALKMAADPAIEQIFLVSRLDLEYVPHQLLAQELDRTIAAYSRFGAKVYIVKQAPVQPHFDKRTYLRAFLRQRFFGDDMSAVVQQQSVSLAEHRKVRGFVDGVLDTFRNDPRVQVVEIEPWLCTTERCSAGTAAGPYYSDNNHLNTAGALRVSGAIAAQLSPEPLLIRSQSRR